MANSLILNIPHSSTFIPNEDLENVFLPKLDFMLKKNYTSERSIMRERDKMIRDELLVMTDWYTDELFYQGIGEVVIAKVSRLVCDTERFSNDSQEVMTTRGMGYCYERGSRNQIIKSITSEYKEEVLWRYYAPHHIALIDATQGALNRNNKAIIIDCHSFSKNPLPYETDQNIQRPEICIGTDNYHTPNELQEKTEKFFRSKGYNVAFNTPYSGTIVPLRFYGKDKRVQSIMIEVNRGVYLRDGTSNKKEREFNRLQEVLKTFQQLLIE